MMSNNSGDQIVPAAKAAHDKPCITIVTWDSPIPSGEGEDLFVAQVDFSQTGKRHGRHGARDPGARRRQVRDPLGLAGRRQPERLDRQPWQTALKDPKYAKLQQVGIVYGNDQSEASYNQALALVDKFPDMRLIMAPTSVGIVAAAKAMQDENLCGKIKVSGLGVPKEMLAYTKNGCAPEFALWSFVDLGYLTYYTAYMLASDAIKAAEGQSFKAGRMGNYTITKDPTRKTGLRVLMGPFSRYNIDNIEASAK